MSTFMVASDEVFHFGKGFKSEPAASTEGVTIDGTVWESSEFQGELGDLVGRDIVTISFVADNGSLDLSLHGLVRIMMVKHPASAYKPSQSAHPLFERLIVMVGRGIGG
jgi:hypothetical protein